uniref:Endonuclease n=1 Tax=Strongyloides venezuelensis TaxID=75913 RepID=A0A0K0FB23_STRVS
MPPFVNKMEQRRAIHIFLVIAIIFLLFGTFYYFYGRVESELEKYGVPTDYNIRHMDGFIVSYDTRNRIPFWVLEVISSKNLERSQNNTRKNKYFSPDKTFYKTFQSTLEDYYKSGYDRGHMAAAGNYLHSKDTMQKTFTLSNIAPQVGKGFNQGLWSNLEQKIRKYIENNVYLTAHILSGPLFIPKKMERNNNTVYIMEYEVLNGRIAVPTHFFKVIIYTNNNKNITYQSYIMPNAKISGSFDKFAQNISTIENYAGFRIFPKIDFIKIKRMLES